MHGDAVTLCPVTLRWVRTRLDAHREGNLADAERAGELRAYDVAAGRLAVASFCRDFGETLESAADALAADRRER